MMNQLTAVMVSVCLCAHASLAYSADKPPSGRQVEMRWGELGPFIARGRLTTVLPDGTVLQGRTLSVDLDALVINVSKSSDKRAYPKGRTSIPRGQVETLSIRRTEGKLGRILLTPAGFFGGAGLLVLAFLGSEGSGGGERSAILPIWVGANVGGYYGGKSIDSKTTVIKILPD